MNDMIRTSNLEAATAARSAALAKYEEARVLIEEANTLASRAHYNFSGRRDREGEPGYRQPGFTLYAERHFKGYPGNLNINEIVKDLDKVLWRNTLHCSGLTCLMSKGEYDKAIDSLEKEPPEFTTDNVKASYADFAGRLDEIENTAIIDLFKCLSWSYKSNEPVKIGKRIVLTGMIWSNRTEYRREHYLDDLEKAIYRARDLSPPANDNRLCVKLNLSLKNREDLYQDNLFKIRAFGNGNVHIYILHQSDRDALNKRIAKAYPGALPATR